MRYTTTMTPQIVATIKDLISHGVGLREIERRVNISYYAVWCVKEGAYDNAKPIKEAIRRVGNFFEWDGTDLITGFTL
jgi:hypothetical protein